MHAQGLPPSEKHEREATVRRVCGGLGCNIFAHGGETYIEYCYCGQQRWANSNLDPASTGRLETEHATCSIERHG